MDNYKSSQLLAETITRSASKQTYLTIRYFADRELVSDAYRAYAYFRWVDDCLDADLLSAAERSNFIKRQQSLLETCYLGQQPGELSSEEWMLADLIRNNPQRSTGLELYLRNMMAVMAFDWRRRGRMITQAELDEYTHLLAIAVTEALHYFIGRNCPSPSGEARYLAVQGAHVIHMLRDFQEDLQTGYINIPSEYVDQNTFKLGQLDDPIFKSWVRTRARLAETYFRRGSETISQVPNLRCRIAGFAYLARFEWMLRAIERDGYQLRADYPERKSWRAGLWILFKTITSALKSNRWGFKPANAVFNS